MLRRDGPALAEAIAGLTDAELDTPVQFRREGPPWTVEQLVERVLIGHVTSHGASIREALGS